MISLGIKGLGIAKNTGSRPSLNLDFINSQIFDPRITFTRVSTATRVNANGLIEVVASGSPRIDFDPVTQVCKGLLIEEQRTNLLTYSENFALTPAWSKSRATISSSVIVAPDGTLTADKLVEDTQTGGHHVNKPGFVFITGTTYCLSVYVQAAERSKGKMQFGNGVAAFGGGTVPSGAYDLIAGTCVKSTYADSAGIQQLSGGWFRVWLVATCTTGAADNIFISFLSDGTTTSYTGDGTSGLYIWGAQLEEGSFPTSYIPSVASQVIRSADSAVMTGTNFSSWYNQNEGTVLSAFDHYMPTSNGYERVYEISDNTSSNMIGLLKNNSAGTFYSNVIVGGVSQELLTTSAIASNTMSRLALSYRLNDFAQVLNGGTAQTDASGTLPVVDRIAIGCTSSNGSNLNGHISKLSYYPKSLTNSELQALTRG